MKEKFIRCRLYHNLACRRTDAFTKLWHIDDFLSHAMAILYPYVRDGIIEQEEKLILPIQAIRTFRKSPKERNFLDSLTELSLIDALKSRWVVKIQNKKEIAKTFLLVDYIDDHDMIHVKPQFIDIYTHLNIPGSDMKYGTEDFIQESEESLCVDENTEDKTKTRMQKNFITVIPYSTKSAKTHNPFSQEEKEFIEMWQIERLPESLNYGNFFWQYKITESQYNKIKSGLISLHFEDKDAKFIRRYAFRISLFLSEWFKREYDGYQNERGLSIIGINSQQSRHIREDSKFPNSYLLKSGQNEYLFSIYVLGGFPINYIRRVRRFDSLLRNIWNIKQGEDIDGELLEEISDSFDTNNAVYQESMRKGGSLYGYIESLVNDDVPLAKEDKEREPYRTYCEMLSEGKRACYDNYLSSIWNIYTDCKSEGIDSFVNVKIGPTNNRCYIPYNCVRMWTESSVPDEFILGLETEGGRKSENTIRFSKSGKVFVGWGNTNIISMMFDVQYEQVIKVMMYSVWDVERNNGKVVQHPFVFPDRCRLYQTSTPYKWSSIRDTKSHSAIFFNSHKFQISDGKEFSNYVVPARDGKPSWVWARIYDMVTLIDVDSSEEILYNSKQGAMNVFFTKHKGVRYNQYDEVTHVFTLDNDTIHSESVPLILGINGIKRVNLYPFEANEAPEKITDYEVFYKQDNWKYQPFNEQNAPRCGMLQLKITYNDYKPIIKKCFYVPQKELLKRKIESKIIQFLSSGINIWKPVGEDYELIKDKEAFDNTTFNNNDDVISFRIGSESDYIILDVYRADDCREIYFENRCISRKKESTIDIPLILKHKFYIRTIDDNGVKRTEPGVNVVLDNNIYSDVAKLANVTKIDKENGIRYYLYAVKYNMEMGHHALRISPKQKDNYQFYYWSCEATDSPIKLNTDYDNNKKCLMVPLDNLQGRCQGIIFQSLKDVTPPNYVLPYYPREARWKLLVDRVYSNDIIEKAIRIAVEHHVYFSQFYPIHRLFQLYDNGKELVNIVVDYLRTNNKKEDFLAMHRMANEFIFEWIALPWTNWKKACKTDHDKQLVEKLFRSNPRITSPIEKTSLDLILERYWTLPKPQLWKFQRKKTIEQKSVENIVLQSIRGIDKDYTFFVSRSKSGLLSYPTENGKVLDGIYNNDSFYKNLQKEIFEKIIN